MHERDFVPRGNIFYKSRWSAGFGHRAGQAHFSGCVSLSQCKEKPGQSLPPQYALELLTVYAWERAGRQSDFITAQGFQTVLKLVMNYQQLCIHWTQYYNSSHPVIGPYLRRQLQKPRYSVPTGPLPAPMDPGSALGPGK